MLSIRPDHPIDAGMIAVMRRVSELTKKLELPYFIAGAMARDILLTNVFGIGTGLATIDVDFAFAVKDWTQFSAIKTELLSLKGFSVSNPETPHRVNYIHEGGKVYPVDILPFRGVEEPRHTIAWPPEMRVMMNVVGYEEALVTAIPVRIDDDLNIRVASLPGLALLKLFAWVDRKAENSKDAVDLVVLFQTYHEAGNQDRLYGEEISVLEAVDYDLAIASPRLLGKDVRRIAAPDTLDKALALLSNAKTRETLAIHMSKRPIWAEDSLAASETLLDQFRAGLQGQ
jgi:predicted nucleotidyltransferase